MAFSSSTWLSAASMIRFMQKRAKQYLEKAVYQSDKENTKPHDSCKNGKCFTYAI